MTAVSCTLCSSTLSVQSYCCESRSVCGSAPPCPHKWHFVHNLKDSTGDSQEVLNVQLLVRASVLSSGALVWVALCGAQLVPGSSAMDPPRDTAECIGGAPLWRCLWERAKCCMAERSEEEGETVLWAPSSEEERCFRCWSRCFPCRPQRITCHSRCRFFWRNGSPWRGAMPEQASAEGVEPVEKTMMDWQKEAVTDWLQRPYSTLPCAALDKGTQRSWGFKVWSLVWGKWATGRGCAVLICCCFSVI